MSTVAPPATGTRTVGFESLDEEVRIESVPVSGEVPEWLTGTLVRVTPALFDFGRKPVGHWFDGMAMLNVFSFGADGVSYANRFLDTDPYRAARQGRIGQPVTMGTDPCATLGRRMKSLFVPQRMGENPNVNVHRLGERYIAATEAPVAVEFDPETLETHGLFEFKDRLGGQHTTFVHPHFDVHGSGDMIAVATNFSVRNEYRLWQLRPGSTSRTKLAGIPAGLKPSYMHSFALTERYVVLPLQPLSFMVPKALVTGKVQDAFGWHPENGTRWIVVDRQTGKVRGEYEGQPFFFWHHINAFERDDEIIVDLVASDGPSSVWDMDLDKLRNPDFRPAFFGYVRRYSIPLDGRTVTGEPLSEARVEFPRINYERNNTRDYQFVWCVAYRGVKSDWFDEIVKVDVTTGESKHWAQDGCYPSEPVFAPAPGSDIEDRGVVMSIVLDSVARKSFLLILDAASLEEIARAEVPHHIPFNFHQNYFE